MMTVKQLVESGPLTHVPARYIFRRFPGDDPVSAAAEAIPTIDFSHLTADSPELRSEAIRALGDACLEWGFFTLVNHGVGRELMDSMVTVCEGFFELQVDELRQYAGKPLFDPVRFHTSINSEVDDVLLWRDSLKTRVHPDFNAPRNPPDFGKISEEYCRKVRKMASVLLGGISLSLGLDERFIDRAMELDTEEEGSAGGETHRRRHHQLLVVNLYPPSPQPELVLGLPPHSDHGLLTVLAQNNVNGLQVRHHGRWVPVDVPPHSFVVNIGDHLEVLSNGRYKSVEHRALVSGHATRLSIGLAHGPPLDAVVAPAPELLLPDDGCPARYRGMQYGDYIQLQQSRTLRGKSCLDNLKILSSDE